MKALAGLTPRERALILGGAALLVIFGAWFYLWQPIAQAQRHEEQRIARYLALIDMTGKTDGALASRIEPEMPDTPLAQRVTQSGEAAGIPLVRLDPDGPRLRVTVAKASYADLIAWIASLEARSAVRTLSVEMSRLTAPGTVSLRLTLEDAS